VRGGVLLAAVLAVPVAVPAAPAAAPAGRERASTELARAIDRVIDAPALASAFWAVEVRSLRDGRVLYERNADKSMKPASALKVVATATALDLYGPDARIRTTVETAGRLDGLGRILGDVYLVGRGDPNLSGRFHEGRITADLEEMAEALRAGGVRRIEGRLIGHEGLFTGERRGEDWAWGDLVWWYGAEVSALAFNDNSADLKVSPGERVGDPLLVERNPRSAYYSVVSTATTAAADTARELRLQRDLGSNVIRLSGTLPLGGTPWENSVALEDPARYTATVFAEVLESRGIVVAGPVITSSDPLPAGLRVLAAHDSPTMAEMLKAVNKPSQNLHAEMLLRLAGVKARGEGTVEAGHETALDFLRRSGATVETWALQDGSGLSRSDLVTARGLVALLTAMARHPHAQAFRDSLPIAGRDGTLASRMKGTPAEGRVFAKTGSLRHVNALAGYTTSRGGEPLVFAIVVNHNTSGGTTAVGAIDEICALLVSH
jgi:D-alanyl-D-alanine carboxypeptidase/D-alanyl-D-alanine-endopeptidase (penicillin-binding protein 4)